MENRKKLPSMHFPKEVIHLKMRGDGIYGRIKKRLAEILAARLSGNDASFENFSEQKKTFEVDLMFLLENPVPGWGYSSMAGYSGDFKEYQSALWEADGYSCHAYIWLELILTGMFETVRDSKNSVGSLLGMMQSDGWTPLSEADPEELTEVITAIQAYGKGLETAEAENFLMGINSCFDDSFSLQFIFENLDTFAACFTESNCDYPYWGHCITSKEIFQYRKYRESVPEGVRRDFDNALCIILDPVADSFDVALVEDNPDEGYVAIFFNVFEYVDGGASFHPLFDHALHFLIEGLPILREIYGGCEGIPHFFFA